ncbi:hypothetical protein ACFRKB_11460 [Streptomyces scopuliridis]|uniref:hypothetical protein n=1 Tax=Streptomyces scopuliridis TaxID=452529 RepID=UPI0036A3BA7A
MACGTCGRAASNVNYEVRLNTGETKTVPSVAEARILIAQSGGTYKAVPKK